MEDVNSHLVDDFEYDLRHGGNTGSPSQNADCDHLASAFTGRSYAGTTLAEIVWTKPSAGTGRITKYVIKLDRASKEMFSHAYSAKTKDAEIRHLRRNTHYLVYVTAYNDYGMHTTIEGMLTTR